MVTVFFIAGFLALLQFVYQGIFLPSYRSSMRLRLFALRDRLRNLREQDVIEEDVFDYAQNTINIAINLLPHLDFYLIREFSKNRDLLEKSNKRSQEIRARCGKDVNDILSAVYTIGGITAIMNNGGWTAPVLPLIVFSVALGKLLVWFRLSPLSKVLDRSTDSAERLFNAPKHEIRKMVPVKEDLAFA